MTTWQNNLRSLGFGIILSAVGVMIWSASAPSTTLAAGPKAKFVQDELLVQFKSDVPEERTRTLFKAKGASHLEDKEQIRMKRIRVTAQNREKIKAELMANPDVAFVEENFIADPLLTPNDPYYASEWHLPIISAAAGWDIGTGSKSVPIAVIDSGVDSTHSDLTGKLITGYNFITGTTDTDDVYGHGTMVAGCAAGSSNNAMGITGIAWNAPIMPLLVTDSTGSATYSKIASAIIYAADAGVRIINISLGGTSSSATIQNAVNYAWARGTVVFAAAGNYANSTPVYPAACDNVVAVGATTSSDTLASFSCYGTWVDVVAPGSSILTTTNGGGYGSASGTSFASPITAGLAALVLAVEPTMSAAQLVALIKDNATDLGATGVDVTFGSGRINVAASMTAAKSVVPIADTTLPSVAITSPTAGASVSATATVTIGATDDTAVESVELYVDGTLVGTIFTAPYTFSWNTTTVTDGTHILKAVAEDTAGNLSTSAEISVTVKNTVPATDTIAPVVTITTPKTGSTIVAKTIVIAASATDNTKVSKMQIYVDGSLKKTSTTGSISYSWSSSTVARGTHTILVKAYDPAGNIGASSISVRK